MKSGPQEPKTDIFKPSRMLPILVLLVVILSAAIYATQHKSSNSSQNAAGWASYKSDKYKLKFNYPTVWGAPTITDSAGDTGKSYIVSFGTRPNISKPASKVISASLDSQDLTRKNCDAIHPETCSTIKAYTSIDVKNSISKFKSSFTATTGNSTGLVTQGPAPSQQTLLVQQVVSLPALKVTAVRANYIINNAPKNCPANKFSSNSSSGCITKATYEDTTKFISSLQNY
jgi:hypothetical protein